MARLRVAQPAMDALAPRLALAEHGAHALLHRTAATLIAMELLTPANQLLAPPAPVQMARQGLAPMPMAALALRLAPVGHGAHALQAFTIATAIVMVPVSVLPRTAQHANAQDMPLGTAPPPKAAQVDSLVLVANGGHAQSWPTIAIIIAIT